LDLLPIRILLVEDNPGDARLLREVLRDADAPGFRIVEAGRLAEALARLEGEAGFDVVLLDLSLPDSHGLDTLRRAHAHAPHVPIVILTGHNDETQAVRAVQEGAQDYLIKGTLDTALFTRAIRYAIERHRMLAELEQARRMEHYVATHDVLTGLPNRQLFIDRLGQALAEARRHGTQVAVLFLDLDRFKPINDTFGHAAGDRLLVAAAHRLAECLRETDTAARLGGDEFTIILTNVVHAEDVAKVSQKLLECLADPFTLEEREIFVSASIGVSLYPGDGGDVEALLKNADTAMYRAKANGKNNFQFYLPAMNERALEWLELERSLRLALERDEFVLHYQPQFDAVSGRIVGMEALLRWRHPELGIVYPKGFIPLAEETGLIVPLGEWVLRTACAQNRAWQNLGLPPVPVAVNFSARQFQRQDPAQVVTEALQATGLDACWLELELTESVVMSDAEAAVATLKELRELGVGISLDDFGTGYSSLSYLKRLPLGKLKIDEIFVRNLMVDPNDRAITAAIVALAHSLNLTPIAEGVERPEQLEVLRLLGCELVQGYLFSRPVDPEDAAVLLARNALPRVEAVAY
jgi:diguanylate cyclase (GGDEF)-like protein